MVKRFNEIFENPDFENMEQAKELVFICANNPDFDLAFIFLTHYPVYPLYEEFWEKGAQILAKNTEYYNHMFPEVKIETEEPKQILPKRRMQLQRKGIREYLKDHPLT